MGRNKKKPDYNAIQVDQKLLDAVAASYARILKQNEAVTNSLDTASYQFIEQTAKEYDISPMKMRKLLITAGVYKNETSELIVSLRDEGKSVSEIQSITGLSRSTVNGYLPYSKVIYKNTESSVGADRVRLLRKRRKACKELQEELSEKKLWECLKLYQGFKFYTVSELPFTYMIKIGKNGGYTREFIVDRRSESKTLTWSSITLAFNNAIGLKGKVIHRPKDLGDIRGVSYIFPVLYYFGAIDMVDEKLVMKMKKIRKS